MKGRQTPIFEIIDMPCSALPGANARDACKDCGCAYGYLGRYIKVDGKVAIRWVCENCEKRGTAGDLPLSVLGGVAIDRIPIVEDRRSEATEFYAGEECVRCGNIPTQQHHWAPQSIFPDWPADLTVALCQRCHDELHERLRAHGLRWPKEIITVETPAPEREDAAW